MKHPIQQIQDTMLAAQPVIETLQHRLSTACEIHDLGDLSVIQTTVRTLDELLGIAAEYKEVLRRQLARTSARIEASVT
ncbi:MAG: hypothetical protein JNL93_24055 [Pelomonas sp.]|nr:hypothetical protein [Roseateles sp.]